MIRSMTPRILCLVGLSVLLTTGPAEARPTAPAGATMATVTYATGFDFADYAAERDGYLIFEGISSRPWGEHPIIWKNIITPGLDFNPYLFDPNVGTTLFDGVPADLKINIGDSDLLNAYEGGGAFSDGGATVDPVGNWMEIFSTDGREVAVFAAMVIWKWSTPVYINYWHESDNGPVSRVAVIDSVTLSVPSGPPHIVCGWDDPDQDATCDGLVIESIKMSFYSDATMCNTCDTRIYFDGPAVSGNSFVSQYEGTLNSLFGVGPVIYDPPELMSLDGVGVESLERASRTQAGHVRLRRDDGELTPSVN